MHPTFQAPLQRVPISSTTTQKRDYVPHPNAVRSNNFKPDEKAISTVEPFEGSTSYNTEFPVRALQEKPKVKNLMGASLLPLRDVTPIYTTTNEEMFPYSWQHMKCRQQRFLEPPSEFLFRGKFDGETIFRSDYGVPKSFVPRTSLKQKQVPCASTAKFEDSTTNKSAYKLPSLGEKAQIHKKTASRKSEETMARREGRMQDITQYRYDNPGYTLPPYRRGMSLPSIDQLNIFLGRCQNWESEQRANYVLTKPETGCKSFKKEEKYIPPTVSFVATSSNANDFQPIDQETRNREMRERALLAAYIGLTDKYGRVMKEVQSFGGEFNAGTTYKKMFAYPEPGRPRILHGDRHEKTFHPTQEKFNMESETKTQFQKPPRITRPVVSFKPKVVVPDRGTKAKGADYSTMYKQSYVVQPFPNPTVCPAQGILLRL